MTLNLPKVKKREGDSVFEFEFEFERYALDEHSGDGKAEESAKWQSDEVSG
jgi:hypothetical protein